MLQNLLLVKSARLCATIFTVTMVLGNQAKADMQTVRTEENGVVYHKLENCEYERGLAWARYMMGTKPAIIELTDICFDREGGQLWASEPEEDLVLVRRSGISEFYEVILPDTKVHQRTAAYTETYDQTNYQANTVNFGFQRKSKGFKPTGKQHNGDVSLHGYIFDRNFKRNDIAGEFSISVQGSDHWEHVKRGGGRDGQTPFIFFTGEMGMTPDGGSVEVVDSGDGGGEGGGNLEFEVHDDGTISGAGTLEMKNARLAGINPEDWKSSQWTIKKLVGHLVGDDGQEFRAIAVARGKTIDHDGTVNEVFGTLNIGGYSKELMERWGEQYSTENGNK